MLVGKLSTSEGTGAALCNGSAKPSDWSDAMYALIDCTSYRPIAVHKDYSPLANLAYIQFANVDCLVMPADENKHWAKFTTEQLEAIYNACAGGAPFPSSTYTQALRATREAVLGAPHLQFPFTAAQLEAQAQCIDDKDDKPYAFDPSSNKPKKLKAWHSGPNVNRPRNAKPSSMQHQPQGQPAVDPSPEELARSAAGTSDAPAKRTRTPRAAGASGPAKRPASGSKTGMVWDIADKVSSKTKLDGKELRKAVIAECEKQGVNKSTASVQFALWASSR